MFLRFRSASSPLALAAITAVALSARALTAQADIIAHYDFADASLASKDVETNSTAGDYSIAIGAMSSKTQTHYVKGDDVAVTLSEVATFSIMADSGLQLNLDNLVFSYAGTHHNEHTFGYALYSSADGYAVPIFVDEVTSSAETWTKSANINLSGPGFQNLSDITFSIRFSSDSTLSTDYLRIVTTQSIANENTGDIVGDSDIILYGTVVPEPGSVTMVLAAIGAFLLLRWQRR